MSSFGSIVGFWLGPMKKHHSGAGDSHKGPDEIDAIDFQLRDGELDAFLSHRSEFWDLISAYAERNNEPIDKNRVFGILYDMIFFVGVNHLRNVYPSMKEIYLSTNATRSTSLRDVEYLQSLGVFARHTDPSDARRTRVGLSEDFAGDFRRFIEEWVQQPRKQYPPRQD